MPFAEPACLIGRPLTSLLSVTACLGLNLHLHVQSTTQSMSTCPVCCTCYRLQCCSLPHLRCTLPLVSRALPCTVSVICTERPMCAEPMTTVGLWWALEDCTKENGCLWAQPGTQWSHVLVVCTRYLCLCRHTCVCIYSHVCVRLCVCVHILACAWQKEEEVTELCLHMFHFSCAACSTVHRRRCLVQRF